MIESRETLLLRRQILFLAVKLTVAKMALRKASDMKLMQQNTECWDQMRAVISAAKSAMDEIIEEGMRKAMAIAAQSSAFP